MITSPNMALKIWNLSTDNYNSAQLAENFARLDEHTHTGPPYGVQIATAGLADGAVTAAKIASGAIPAPPAQQPVGTALIVDNAVTSAKIANGAITVPKLGTTPHAKITRTVVQPIAAGAGGASVIFTAATFDTGSMWNAASSTVLTCNEAGLYHILAEGTWVNNLSNFRAVEIWINNVAVARQGVSPGGNTPSYPTTALSSNVSTLVRLGLTDTIALRAYSGTTLDFSGVKLAAAWISP